MIPVQTILGWIWAVMGAYWLLSALRTKKTEVNEASGWRVMRLSLLVVVFTLLLTDRLRIGFLGWRFMKEYSWNRWVGIAVTVAGLAICVWARQHLGEYWSDKVVLKVEHRLILSGPYAFLRHPIYSGVLLAIAGSALAIGEWRGVLALLAMTINYWVKGRREDRILSSKFGDAFEEHRRRAGFFLPKF